MVHTERQRPEVGIRMDGETAREEKSRVRCELTAANTKKLYRLMISVTSVVAISIPEKVARVTSASGKQSSGTGSRSGYG